MISKILKFMFIPTKISFFGYMPNDISDRVYFSIKKIENNIVFLERQYFKNGLEKIELNLNDKRIISHLRGENIMDMTYYLDDITNKQLNKLNLIYNYEKIKSTLFISNKRILILN